MAQLGGPFRASGHEPSGLAQIMMTSMKAMVTPIATRQPFTTAGESSSRSATGSAGPVPGRRRLLRRLGGPGLGHGRDGAAAARGRAAGAVPAAPRWPARARRG